MTTSYLRKLFTGITDLNDLRGVIKPADILQVLDEHDAILKCFTQANTKLIDIGYRYDENSDSYKESSR